MRVRLLPTLENLGSVSRNVVEIYPLATDKLSINSRFTELSKSSDSATWVRFRSWHLLEVPAGKYLSLIPPILLLIE